ncbi:hypothetical protein [Deinococcus navajonensis]|uniref:Uncharacterized protein n=1 Tax=Deinococcus navajonensis TaxID=309884 RepID=A0ABV8XJF1_9DEIO
MIPTLRTAPRHVWLPWVLLALTVAGGLALKSIMPTDGPLLAQLVLFDATVTTALLVFLFTPAAERQLRASLLTILRGVTISAFAFPEVRAYVWLDLLGVAASVFFLQRGLRSPLPAGYADLDDLERLYAFFGRLSGRPRMVRLPLYDVLLLKHLVVRPNLPQGQHFGTRQGATTGSTLTLVAFGSAVEGMLAHVLLAQWNDVAAWIWTGLNGIGLLWLLAYGRALATRPVTVSARRLYLRSGLHWTGSTPLSNLVEARPFQAEDTDALNIAIDVKPNVTLTFSAPVQLSGVYLTERRTQVVALHVDDPRAFVKALNPETAAHG